MRRGYEQRVAADPSFLRKSLVELMVGASTQLSAEWNIRGASQLLPQIDFVIADIFAAMAGKYYSMWRVAPTLEAKPAPNALRDPSFAGIGVPTNAFQETLLDGITRPSLPQRMLAFVVPMPSLFQAGSATSALGYGLVAALIFLRTQFIPSYEAVTHNMNVFHASLFSGMFVATISNLRYQVMQGIVEPKIIDRVRRFAVLHAVLTALVRFGNGFVGSWLAISGMRKLGLQKLKT